MATQTLEYSDNDTKLHTEVRTCQVEKVRKILDLQVIDVNCQNSKHETPLHLACSLKHADIVQLLVAFGANPCIKDSNNRDCYGRSSQDVADLLNKLLYSPKLWLEGPTIALADCNTSLHDAVKLKQLKNVQSILEQQTVDINSINSAHETPMHIACAYGHREIVYLLGSHGANMYIRDCYNNTSIHRAVSSGHSSIANSLIIECACDPTIKGFQGRSLLHYACGAGNIEFIEELIVKYKFDPITDMDACGNTALHIAAMCGQMEVTNLLINKYNCHVDCRGNSRSRKTPLHLACFNGCLNVIRTLVSKHSADLHALNFQDNSPLQLAAMGGHANVVKVLISEFGCSLDDKGFIGKTILHHACECGHVDLAETLISEYGIHPTCKDDNGGTPLHYAAVCGHLSVIRMLVLKHNASLKAHTNQNKSPLQLAARGGHANVVKVLISEFGCSLDDNEFEGITILHQACGRGHVDLAETLISEYGMHPMCKDDNDNTPLHYAALYGHLSVIRMLVLKHNASLDAHNNQNDSPLQLAAIRGHTNLVKVLISEFGCSLDDKGFKSRTILHQACGRGHVDLAATLISEYGMHPMCKDDYGNTPFHYAALYGHLSVIRMLVLKHNASLNAHNNQNNSPLQLATRGGHANVVNVLISEFGCSLDDKGFKGKNILHQACEHGHVELAESLIAQFKSISLISTDEDGNTPLHIATKFGQQNCVNMLLYKHHAPIYVRNKAGKTARDTAENIHIKSVIRKYLREFKENIQSNYKELQRLSLSKYSGERRLTRVLVLGNIQSGKSTLIESLKRDGFISFYFGNISEAVVPPHTSGIVPSVHDSKTVGRLLYFDFAGDQEYHSSHSAIMSHVLKSQYGTTVFFVVVNLTKDIQNIHDELGYWFSFVSFHSCRSKCNVVVIGSHTDVVTSSDTFTKFGYISHFVQKYSSVSSVIDTRKILTLDCRQPRSSQSVRDILRDLSISNPPYDLSLEAAILLGLIEKDFKNVVTCKLQNLISHITETKICLPTTAKTLYPTVEQLQNIGLLLIIGRACDKLEDHFLLLNIPKLTCEVHDLLFSSSAIEKFKIKWPHLIRMGILPHSYLKAILPDHISIECLIQLEYCQAFSHIEVKLDYLITTEESTDAMLLYFPALCRAEGRNTMATPDDFNYCVGCVIECKQKLDYFTSHCLHVLFLRLAYSFALPVTHEHVRSSTPSYAECDLATVHRYSRRCSMWRNGICWRMEGVECYVESINSSKGVVVLTKSKESQKSICLEMLVKVIREIQQVKEEFCEPVTLQYFLMDSDDPASANDENKLFAMSEVERVLKNGKSSVVSINGNGHLDTQKISLLLSYTFWKLLFPLDIGDILHHIKAIVVDWRYLGICLKMQYYVLDEISANNPRNIVACKEQMMSRWISRDSLATPSCWWVLVKAIENMGQNLIAKQIKKVHGQTISLQEKLVDQQYSNLKPEENFLRSFAKVIGKDWPHLASLLSLSTKDIMQEVKRQGKYCPADQALYMLQKWRLKDIATYGQLYKSLRAIILRI